MYGSRDGDKHRRSTGNEAAENRSGRPLEIVEDIVSAYSNM